MENTQNRIKIRETIIVEGKYDKIRLSALCDANIMELGGFRIYNDRERLKLIRRIAERTGIVILTDSDSAGFRLRHYLSSAIPGANIKNVYIPDIHGKEKRKPRPGKENLVGVEGMSTETLLKAFAAAGITPEGEESPKLPFTKIYLYELGLSGGENSAALRKKLCEKLELPKMLSANALAEILPVIITGEELESAVAELR
ncbi:MAG: toprim domain-containing protein [Oscillospiraceae bacterium]